MLPSLLFALLAQSRTAAHLCLVPLLPLHVLLSQAAQVWNHTFYFNCLAPPSEETCSPLGPTLKRINRDFGSLDNLKQQFKEKVLKHFGSGEVMKPEDVYTPETQGDRFDAAVLLLERVFIGSFDGSFQNPMPVYCYLKPI